MAKISGIVAKAFFLIFPFLWVSIASSNVNEFATVNLSLGGSVRGRLNKLGAFEFLGIRYGEAVRWATANLDNNTAASDALYFGSNCPQICQTVLCPETIAEDCLFLNIWTPFNNASEINSTSTSLPVIVFFHGGSFQFGGAGMAAYDGAELALRMNAIVVSFNYRLGVLGFLDLSALDNTAQTTNFGLLDQRVALKWIARDIHSFGGNFSRSTFLGQSAGAQSILMHLADQATREQISKVFLMSPPAIKLSTRLESQELAAKLAKSLKCAAVTCLRDKSMRAVLNAAEEDDDTEKKLAKIEIKSMAPVMDGVDIILNPFDILGDAHVTNGVQAIIGGVSYEAYLFLKEAFSGEVSSGMFNVALDALFAPNAKAVQQVYNAENDDYLADRKPHLTDMIGDWLFLCPLRKSIRASLSTTVRSYIFEAPWLGGSDEPLGNICDDHACHTTDLSYLFRTPSDAVSQPVGDAFRSYFHSFVHDLDLTISDPPWLPATLSEFTVLRFPAAQALANTSYTPILDKIHPLAEKCDLWDRQGYQFSPRFEDSYIYSLQKKSAGLSVPVLGVAISMVGFFLGTNLFLLLGSFALRYHFRRLFRVICASEEGLNDEKGRKPSMSKYQTMGPEEMPRPVMLECKNVTYRAGDVANGKRLLDAVSFKCEPGTITAIMGPSGAGKTTLLSLLNRRLKASAPQEKILFAGQPLSSYSATAFRFMTGFVPQHDPPYYGLTVREVMIFNSLLELPVTRTHAQRSSRIDRLLNLLNLTSCADVVIQRPEHNQGGISGGQMRRLSIAVALLKKPSVLFLDEPTSGLDAKSTLDVGIALSQLAGQGYTVVVSIHQPRPEMFRLFSQVVVLVYGRLLYANTPEGSESFFLYLRNKLVEKETNAAVLEEEEDADEAKDGKKADEANPADLIMDVAGAIRPRNAAWASSQWDEYVERDQRPEGHLAITRNESWMDVVGKDVAPSPILALEYLPYSKGSSDTAKKRSSLSITFPFKNKTSVQPDTSTHRGFTLPPAVTTIAAAGSMEALKISSGKTLKIRSKNIKPWPVKQIFIIASRWWTTRPVRRKFNMMIISGGGVWLLALLQRRPGNDALSIVLQTKGLALACVGLPALKNIHISFDYYEDRDVYNNDSENGSISPIAFFCHRLLYETAMATMEGLAAVISAYFILECNPDPSRIGTVLSIFLLYYNCTTTLFTLVYCTRLGRPEARSVAFFSQAVLAITSGIWIKKGDSSVYDWIAWFQYLNPTFWALSPLIRANAAGVGECIFQRGGYCHATIGDVIVEEARTDKIPPGQGIVSLALIWLAMRTIQFLLLLRDAYWDTFWNANKRKFGPSAWVRASQKVLDGALKKEMGTQTGDSVGNFDEGFLDAAMATAQQDIENPL